MARLAVLALVVATVLAPRPAAASPSYSLPATVRVNVAGSGTTSARISSTGSVTAADPSGKALYSGTATLVARRNVYRIRGGSSLPDRSTPPANAEERRSRLELVREARLAMSEGMPAIELVPFELAAIQGSDAMGDSVERAPKVQPLHFTSADGILLFNGRAFRGALDLTTDDEGDMIVVNTVDTASYLASVVGSEIPASWLPEALAAQAIAARTYLMTHLARHNDYDIEGDTRDQEYEGLRGETAETIRAVQRTKGIVATYDGAPIETLYGANAGGVTEDSENVFANARPYLRSVPSPWDSEAASSSWGAASWEWTKEWTAPQLSRYLAQRGVDVGDLVTIELVQTSPTGRVLRARVVGSRGSDTIGKDRTRYYFGLSSSLFTVAKHEGGEAEVVQRSDDRRISQLETLGATRTHTTYAVGWDNDHEIAHFALAGYEYVLPARFVFTGRGDGHGVGMSQWGMEGMALAGASAEQILKHYYTGIALTDIGGA